MAPHKPVIDQRAAEQMNLNVLKRMDPQIEELLATAGHVALYDFDIPTKRWSRKDVEGSLFLVKRRVQPRFQFVILNKKSAVAADNFVEDVHGGFQCEVQKPYVLYRNRANEVVGIWFYDDADCDRISALLQRIASTFAAPSEAAAGAAAATEAAPPAAQPAQPPPAPAAPAAEGSEAGDAGFWDRRVQVPDGDGAAGAHPLQPATALLVPTQLQQPQAAALDTGSSNDLARLFAGIKVGGPAPAAAAPAAAAPPAAAPPTAAPMMLLTPQLLQQEAGGQAAPAAAAAEPASDAAAPGNVLLQSLLRGSQPQPQPQPSAAAPVQRPVDITEAADRALRAKVASLLSSLAGNDAFCGLLATELKKAGLV